MPIVLSQLTNNATVVHFDGHAGSLKSTFLSGNYRFFLEIKRSNKIVGTVFQKIALLHHFLDNTLEINKFFFPTHQSFDCGYDKFYSCKYVCNYTYIIVHHLRLYR